MPTRFTVLAHEPPLSDRVASALRERISGGALSIADQLPSEKAMTSESGAHAECRRAHPRDADPDFWRHNRLLGDIIGPLLRTMRRSA